jgi:MoaE-MoaD fusion protein
MQVRILLFGQYRDAAAAPELVLELPSGSTASDAVASLRAERAAAVIPERPVVAVNLTYGSLDDILNDGDELALLPPVAGG